jgi:hypothetical protein
VYNSETNESFWKFPQDVMMAVIEFDRKRMEKKERRERGEASEDEDETTVSEAVLRAAEEAAQKRELEALEAEEDDDGEEQEEEESDDDGGDSKRQRTDDGPIEFNEDDLAAELEEEYGFDDNEWDEEEAPELSEEDAQALFFDLLEDHKINPFSTWDKIIEEGRIIEDTRYTALPNMKSRKAAWDDWSRRKIQAAREARERQAKQDPRLPYFNLLQDHATPKLYWPEFRRKYRKEDAMKNTKVSDKDREKWYREYIKRLQLPSSTLKADFTALIKSLPVTVLNRDTDLNSLPTALLTDLRYLSLAASIRNPLLEAFIPTLPPAPDSSDAADLEETAAKRKARERREKALAERERRVEAEKKRQERDLRFGKGQLREGERELERAMQIKKSGIKTHLAAATSAAADDDDDEKTSD